MFNYYLWEQSYQLIGIEALQNNLIRLNSILIFNDEHDLFLRSDALWNVIIDKELDFSTCVFSALPNKRSRSSDANPLQTKAILTRNFLTT